MKVITMNEEIKWPNCKETPFKKEGRIFFLGILLMIIAILLYTVIMLQHIFAPLEYMVYYVNMPTYIVILSIVGLVLCVYSFYKETMADKQKWLNM